MTDYYTRDYMDPKRFENIAGYAIKTEDAKIIGAGRRDDSITRHGRGHLSGLVGLPPDAFILFLDYARDSSRVREVIFFDRASDEARIIKDMKIKKAQDLE